MQTLARRADTRGHFPLYKGVDVLGVGVDLQRPVFDLTADRRKPIYDGF